MGHSTFIPRTVATPKLLCVPTLQQTPSPFGVNFQENNSTLFGVSKRLATCRGFRRSENRAGQKEIPEVSQRFVHVPHLAGPLGEN